MFSQNVILYWMYLHTLSLKSTPKSSVKSVLQIYMYTCSVLATGICTGYSANCFMPTTVHHTLPGRLYPRDPSRRLYHPPWPRQNSYQTRWGHIRMEMTRSYKKWIGNSSQRHRPPRIEVWCSASKHKEEKLDVLDLNTKKRSLMFWI